MKKMNQVMKSVKENAELASDILRVKFELCQATDALAKMIRRLGSHVYEQHISGNDLNEGTEKLLEKIDEKRADMDVLYAELYALNGKVECDACHAVVSADYDFCPKCGTRLFYSYDTDGNLAEAESDTADDGEIEVEITELDED